MLRHHHQLSRPNHNLRGSASKATNMQTQKCSWPYDTCRILLKSRRAEPIPCYFCLHALAFLCSSSRIHSKYPKATLVTMQADADMIKAYRDFVRFRQERNPCVRGLSAFLETPRLPQDLCQIYVVHVDIGGNPDESQEIQKVHHNQLPSALEPPPPGRGRLIVIEDLHPSVLEVLGVTLDIDPIFFADYVVTNLENIERSPAPPSVALTPSQIQSRGDWFHIHYQQVIDLGPDGPPRHSPWVLKTFANVPRAVRRLPPLHGRQLGIARACFSILTKCMDQSWIGMCC